MKIKELLELGIENHASDIHLSPNTPPIYRVNGDLVELNLNPISKEILNSMLSEVMTDDHKKILAKKRELDFVYSISEQKRFRMNIYYQEKGTSAAIRIIPYKIPTFSDLNLPPILKNLCQKEHGLILVTGPTGSGKSTSLAAMIQLINETQYKHIITIEDPIEFIHPRKKCLITQREIKKHTTSFNCALHAALREDPDIIMLGELRDLESIRLALTAAETGHLVLATLHTASAPKTIERILDVFPGNEKEMMRTILSESLTAVVSQKLIKKSELERVAMFEILINNPAIKNLIRESKTPQIYSVMQSHQASGMCTFEQYAIHNHKTTV